MCNSLRTVYTNQEKRVGNELPNLRLFWTLAKQERVISGFPTFVNFGIRAFGSAQLRSSFSGLKSNMLKLPK